MIVMNKDGEIFDERRKSDRRLCQRRDKDLVKDEKICKDDRRKDERRKDDINKK